jgi:hypothetical protein
MDSQVHSNRLQLSQVDGQPAACGKADLSSTFLFFGAEPLSPLPWAFAYSVGQRDAAARSHDGRHQKQRGDGWNKKKQVEVKNSGAGGTPDVTLCSRQSLLDHRRQCRMPINA